MIASTYGGVINMPTKFVTVRASGDAVSASESIVRDLRAGLGGESPALVIVFASTAQPLETLAPALDKAFPDATILGASTAGEFTEQGDTKKGVSAVAIAGAFKVHAGIGMQLREDPEAAIHAALAAMPAEVEGHPHRTGILLLDTMAGNCEEVALLTAAELGPVPLAGGAAADDLRMESTVVSCGGRAATNAVVVAQIFSKEPLGLGVCHGHQPLSEPLRITKSSGNVVQAIEGRSPWDVWREKTQVAAKAQGIDLETLKPEDEGAFLLRFEAGLATTGDTYKIRAPLSRDAQGAIQFACGIPEGSVIRITQSTPDAQIDSAREAARRAKAKLGDKPPAGAIVFDCICRNLMLGDRFGKAVSAISEELGSAPIVGFETYGEIALDAGDMSGFHNTTSVVLAFP